VLWFLAAESTGTGTPKWWALHPSQRDTAPGSWTVLRSQSVCEQKAELTTRDSPQPMLFNDSKEFAIEWTLLLGLPRTSVVGYFYLAAIALFPDW